MFDEGNEFILRPLRFSARRLIYRALFSLNFLTMFCALGWMPTMTAKQPFRDRTLDDEKSVVAESKSTSPVIQLTRKFSVVHCFGAADAGASEPKDIRHNLPDDLDLPSFPGEAWFGG
jgi:hypothetical protein